MNFGGQQPQGPPRLSGFSDRPGGAFQVGQKRPFPDGHGQPAQQPAHVGFGAPNGGPGGSHFLPRHPSEPAPFGSPPPAVGWRDPALFVHETAEKRRQLLDNPQLLASRLTELERIADDSSNKLEAVQLELEASRSERDRLKLELHQSNEAMATFERTHKESSDKMLHEMTTLRTSADAWKAKLELNSKASNELAAVMAQQLQRLNATFDELRASKEQTERACNERIQVVQRERDELAKKCAQLQAAKADADGRHADALATHAADADELRSQLALSRSGFQVEFDGMAKKLEQAKAGQAAAERAAAERVALSKKENDILRSKLLKLDSALGAAEKAAGDKANAVATAEQLERQLADKQLLINTQVQKISKADEAVRKMKQEREADRAQFEPNKKLIDQLRMEIAELEASKLELREAADQAKRDVQAIRAQNEKLDAGYMNAMLAKSEHVRKTQHLEQQLSSLQAELEAEHWRCADLQAELQVLKAEGISATVKVAAAQPPR
eukprot:TRINITY_DN5330_c0_g1_i2.p1 TRINITY_DN5330_c0_g1~~TRINITY_DN5330_c0_g1_i2.p1  ORF type:complete len:501 (+),score=247.01 TRINITY_DN5330_c0_g1_i2:198-1700(+)